MTIKEKLNKKLEKLNARRDEVMTSILNEDDKETRAAMGETLKALKDDIDEVEGMLADIDEPAPMQEGSGDEGRKLNPVAAMQTRTAADKDEGTSSIEYRKAFQKYMATQEQSSPIMRAVARNRQGAGPRIVTLVSSHPTG